MWLPGQLSLVVIEIINAYRVRDVAVDDTLLVYDRVTCSDATAKQHRVKLIEDESLYEWLKIVALQTLTTTSETEPLCQWAGVVRIKNIPW